MTTPRILVVGSANIDLVTRVPRCPKPGESMIGSSFTTVCGGKGANQAVAAARLGAQVHFAGCVGNDTFGTLQRQTLSEEGIDLTYLNKHPELPTGTAVIMVADEGQNSIIVTPAANYGITPAHIEKLGPLFETLDAVMTQLEIPLETVEALLRTARAANVLSVLDAGPAQKVPESIVELADIVSPNETEAEAMTGVAVSTVDDARQAAAQLLAMGAKSAVIKMGAGGALYMSGKEWIHVPAYKVEAVDTVAAGDAFTAALTIAWRRKPPLEAIRFANATGALATTMHGAQRSMPHRSTVDDFLKQKGH
ncbi:MAG: ribokinase [Candidatus Hydrogenedentes bacterium]|nr:ribokinase [Candidatus Hydrogenedentota bacterium]